MRILIISTMFLSNLATAQWVPFEDGCIVNKSEDNAAIMACSTKDGAISIAFVEEDGCRPDTLVANKKSVPIECKTVPQAPKVCVLSKPLFDLLEKDPNQPFVLKCKKQEFWFNLKEI